MVKSILLTSQTDKDYYSITLKKNTVILSIKGENGTEIASLSFPASDANAIGRAILDILPPR